MTDATTGNFSAQQNAGHLAWLEYRKLLSGGLSEPMLSSAQIDFKAGWHAARRAGMVEAAEIAESVLTVYGMVPSGTSHQVRVRIAAAIRAAIDQEEQG